LCACCRQGATNAKKTHVNSTPAHTRTPKLQGITVTEPAGFTVDEAKRRPDKVRAAIEKTLDKAIQKAAVKPRATPLVLRPFIDASK